MDFYHYRLDVYTLPKHIYVQTTCKVNLASDDPFKHEIIYFREIGNQTLQ